MRKNNSYETQSKIRQWNNFATVQLNNMARDYRERDFYRHYFLSAADKLKKLGYALSDESAYNSLMKSYMTFTKGEDARSRRMDRKYRMALAVVMILLAVHYNPELITSIKSIKLVRI